ncbi:MAG: superoxide dismutase family protein [Acidobacteriota bacterium]|nr:superoxide dismutase family protein [Acidobacteriota bacterium]
MRTGWLAVAVLGLAVMGAQAQKPGVVKVAIKSGAGTDVGSATFKTVKKGVQVKIELKNMPIGVHAVHIHQNAVCEGPDFKTAGAHFNPDGKMHGFDNPMGHHNGDFPGNVTVEENHRGEATFVLTTVTLDKGAPNSVFANGGTSLVVHEKADDEKTDPSGASGNRIACGVIQ